MSSTERLDGADQQPLDTWSAAQRSEAFVGLRRRLRGFIFPMTAFFLAWYFVYVLLAAFAPDFMAVRLVGNINVGLVIGLLQFITTFAITTVYVRFANRHLDPVSTQIRQHIEGASR